MDMGELRGLATILCMIGFFSVSVWAYSASRSKDFTEASLLPFADEHEPGEEMEEPP
jgi:cytochrome c oxidase cbb3-type subunit 4